MRDFGVTGTKAYLVDLGSRSLSALRRSLTRLTRSALNLVPPTHPRRLPLVSPSNPTALRAYSHKSYDRDLWVEVTTTNTDACSPELCVRECWPGRQGARTRCQRSTRPARDRPEAPPIHGGRINKKRHHRATRQTCLMCGESGLHHARSQENVSKMVVGKRCSTERSSKPR